jgi:hypothetical protein
MSPLTIALALLIGLLVLIPTRRLAIAGASQRALVVYFVSVWLVGLVAATLRGPARFILPILLIVYLAPFVTLGQGLERMRGRFGGRLDPWIRRPPDPTIKDVTPRDEPPVNGSR